MLRSLALSFSLLALPLAAQEMAKPGPEHQKLAAVAGNYDVVVEPVGADGKAAPASKGTSAFKMALGGFWLTEKFAADFGGMKFQGRSTLGYDPVKGKYVQSWIDSKSPSLLVMEGGFDRDGKVLTMTGTGPGMDGKPAKMRDVTTWKDANTFTFQMFVTGADGKEASMMKITYTRRAEKSADAAEKKLEAPDKKK